MICDFYLFDSSELDMTYRGQHRPFDSGLLDLAAFFFPPPDSNSFLKLLRSPFQGSVGDSYFLHHEIATYFDSLTSGS